VKTLLRRQSESDALLNKIFGAKEVLKEKTMKKKLKPI